MAQIVLLLSLLVLVSATSHGPVQAIESSTAAPMIALRTPPARLELLDAHNRARAEVGVGPLKWSEALATLTSRLVRYQRKKMGCQPADLSAIKYGYGGNQGWASGQVMTPRAVVEGWVKEKSFYNYTNNSCAPGHNCGTYTQIVWAKSMELGCAQATCVKGWTTLTICFYNPPGNYIGERPY